MEPVLTIRQLLILRKMARSGCSCGHSVDMHTPLGNGWDRCAECKCTGFDRSWSIRELHENIVKDDGMTMYTLGNIVDCLQRRGYVQREFSKLRFNVTVKGLEAAGVKS